MTESTYWSPILAHPLSIEDHLTTPTRYIHLEHDSHPSHMLSQKAYPLYLYLTKGLQIDKV